LKILYRIDFYQGLRKLRVKIKKIYHTL